MANVRVNKPFGVSIVGITNKLNTKIVDSCKDAPNYGDDFTLLEVLSCIVVGKGMKSGNPSVDLQLVDDTGNKFVVVTTGSFIEGLAGAVADKRILDTDVPAPANKH